MVLMYQARRCIDKRKRAGSRECTGCRRGGRQDATRSPVLQAGKTLRCGAFRFRYVRLRAARGIGRYIHWLREFCLIQPFALFNLWLTSVPAARKSIGFSVEGVALPARGGNNGR